MNAYALWNNQGYFIDAAVRAEDETEARGLVPEGVEIDRFDLIRQDVAAGMGVPEQRGYHTGAISRWLRGPTTLTGDLNRPD